MYMSLGFATRLIIDLARLFLRKTNIINIGAGWKGCCMNNNREELENVRKAMRQHFKEMGITMNGSMGAALTKLIEATDQEILGENFRHAQIAAEQTYMEYLSIARALADRQKELTDARDEAKRYYDEIKKGMEALRESGEIEDAKARAAYQLYSMITKQAELVSDMDLKKIIYRSGSYAVWAFLSSAPMPVIPEKEISSDKSSVNDERKPWKRY